MPSSLPPPRLHFDDGSRIITANTTSNSSNNNKENDLATNSGTTVGAYTSRDRNKYSVETYYEINRVSKDVLILLGLISDDDDRHCLNNNKKYDDDDSHDDENNEDDIYDNEEEDGNDTYKKSINNNNEENEDTFLCRVALQFPDELISDAPTVAWLIEESLSSQYEAAVTAASVDATTTNITTPPFKQPLVFVLSSSDADHAPCCPNEMGALHLNANVIVHFGKYVCLSPTDNLPVIYSFGPTSDENEGNHMDGSMGGWNVDQCAKIVTEELYRCLELQQNDATEDAERLLLLFEPQYANKMKQLGKTLRELGQSKQLKVVVASIPSTWKTLHSQSSQSRRRRHKKQPLELSSAGINDVTIKALPKKTKKEKSSFLISGLKVPFPPSHLPLYRVLYIGGNGENTDNDTDADNNGSGTSNNECSSTRFLNTVLRCTSSSSTLSAKSCWSYHPFSSFQSSSSSSLDTDPSSTLKIHKYLSRRYYLIQKSRLSSIIGIIVSTLTSAKFRQVIRILRNNIELSGRACYTFVIGSVNIAKLANFGGTIDCFVLVSCGETSVLQDEREYHVPIITPKELHIALDLEVWGGEGVVWSCDFGDFIEGASSKLVNENEDNEQIENNNNNDKCNDDNANNNNYVNHTNHSKDFDSDKDVSDDDDDEPFFDPISGTFVCKPKNIQKQQQQQQQLQNQPGSGQLIQYRSAAAEIWKNKEYQGLESRVGKNNVMKAVKGRSGIASNYGET